LIDQVDPLALVIADGDLNQIKATGSGGAGQYSTVLMEKLLQQMIHMHLQIGYLYSRLRDKMDVQQPLVEIYLYYLYSNYFTLMMMV
jgi:hypothetical protein